MRFRLSRIERIAGIFVLTTLGGAFIFLIAVVAKQGWFESRHDYEAVFESADGVHPGTLVQMAGVKIGTVEDVELTAENKIFVRMSLLEKFSEKLRKDSIASLVRPFIISERVIDVSPGSRALPRLAYGATISSAETTDLMTILSGKSMGNYLAEMTDMLGNLRGLMETFLSHNRTSSLIQIFDRMDPLLKNMNVMSLELTRLSRQATKDEQLSTVLGQLAMTTKELNAILPDVETQAPRVAKDMSTLVSNLAELTSDFKSIIPAVSSVDLPRTSRRAVEALDEAVILMKALEKSFLVRSNVKEVREEESNRVPASSPVSSPMDGH